MAYLLDTNVVIDLRDGVDSTTDRASRLDDLPQVSIVTRVELESGLARAVPQWELRRVRLDALLLRFMVYDFDAQCADAYRLIIAAAGFSRVRLLDRMIAATALVHDLTLITTNSQDFRDVPGLRLEAW